MIVSCVERIQGAGLAWYGRYGLAWAGLLVMLRPLVVSSTGGKSVCLCDHSPTGPADMLCERVCD